MYMLNNACIIIYIYIASKHIICNNFVKWVAIIITIKVLYMNPYLSDSGHMVAKCYAGIARFANLECTVM